jgi:hypothetical protein
MNVQDSLDLTQALEATRHAIRAVTQIGDRGDAELCRDLVGVEPKLQEVEEQLKLTKAGHSAGTGVGA